MRRLLTAFALVALACAAPAATAAAQGSQPPAPSSACSSPHRTERFFARFPVDGVQRRALVNVPAAAASGRPLPLLFMFHGAGGTALGTEGSTGLTQVATRYGFIMVYPEANGKYWNLTGGGSEGNDDVEFVRSLLDQLDGVLCIDDSRVYAAGGSNGGGFVSRLSCEMNDRLAGIASVAGLYGREPACQPQHPISVLEMHGTADTTVPYNGSASMNIASVWSFLVKWSTWDSCPSSAPRWRRLGPGALWESKTGCADGTSVAHIKLRGEPHAWPRADWYPGPHDRSQAVPFDAATAILQFFSRGTVSAQKLPLYRDAKKG